jgi:hypothetical protein
VEDGESGGVFVGKEVLQRGYVLPHLDEHASVALGQRKQTLGTPLVTTLEPGLVVLRVGLGVGSGE